MRSRNLRIAWSAACAIACVLTVALWVRSHYRNDSLRRKHLLLTSWPGSVCITYLPDDITAQPPGWTFTSRSTVLQLYLDDEHRQLVPSYLGFQWCRYSIGRMFVLAIPNWFLTAATFVAATLPWLPWRRWQFSLRMLLVLTTLLAITLGVIVWSMTSTTATPPLDHVDVPVF